MQNRLLLNWNVSTFTRLHVRTLARWNWEMEIGKWELGISIFYFLFPIAIAVRLSCPAVSGGSKIKNKKMSKKLNPIDI